MPAPSPHSRPPTLGARLAVALAVALATGAYAAGCLATRQVASDFEVWWQATRLLAAGVDPYTVERFTREWPFDGWLFYPLPALLATLPVAWLPMPAAGGVVAGASCGAIAWAVTGTGWWRLTLLLHPGVILALKVGQWTPLLTAAALLPALGALAAVKPTLGLGVLAYRARWGPALAAAAFLLVSVAVLPTWPAEWLANLERVEGHPAPILTPMGAVLGLAVLRWRTPEGRLLLTLACVPQLLFFADQLPLVLVARTRRELQLVVGAALAATVGWGLTLAPGDPYVARAGAWVMAGVYLPALAVVLRRPNRGDTPAWLEALLAGVARPLERAERRAGEAAALAWRRVRRACARGAGAAAGGCGAAGAGASSAGAPLPP